MSSRIEKKHYYFLMVPQPALQPFIVFVNQLDPWFVFFKDSFALNDPGESRNDMYIAVIVFVSASDRRI